MEYRIGCSGYYYPQWKNKLYPKGLPPKEWLSHYSTIFNTVELNGTFYRTPALSHLKRYRTTTHENFTFSVKMNRYLTHILRLKEKQPIAEFQDLILQGLETKLQHFLFQMPPSFHYTEEHLDTILAHVPHNPRNVVELRHSSWWNETVEAAFKKARITFCNVDFPGLDTRFMNTSPNFYLRLHGSPELFKTPYTTRQLEAFYRKIPATRTCAIYFNNTITEAGYKNALTMMGIVSESP